MSTTVYTYNNKVLKNVATDKWLKKPVDPLNPLGLPANTVRVKYISDFTPRGEIDFTLVDAENNIWDITNNYAYQGIWDSLFKHNYTGGVNLIEVLGANTTNVTSMNQMFSGCTNLTSVSLPKLTTLTGSLAMSQTFRGTGITTLTLGGTSPITFSAYKDIFKNMFQDCSQNITVNAPAGNQTDIEALDGYPNFGGTGSVTWNWVS